MSRDMYELLWYLAFLYYAQSSALSQRYFTVASEKSSGPMLLPVYTLKFHFSVLSRAFRRVIPIDIFKIVEFEFYESIFTFQNDES